MSYSRNGMEDGTGMCGMGFDCKDSVKLDLTYHVMHVCRLVIVLFFVPSVSSFIMYRDKSSVAGLRACFYFNTYSIPITFQFLLVIYEELYILIQVLFRPHQLAVSLTLPRLTFQFSISQTFRIIFLLFIITCGV